MKIMYVLGETPFVEQKGGGIATYLRHAVKAQAAAGNCIRVVTWQFIEEPHLLDRNALPELSRDDVVVLRISSAAVARTFPSAPTTQAVSQYLASMVAEQVRIFGPDVIETSDFGAPLYGYLMHRRAGMLPDLARIPVFAMNHGLSRPIHRLNDIIPSAWDRQGHAAERIQLIWADRVLVPSHAARQILARQISDLSHVHLLPEPFYWRGRTEAPPEPRSRFVFLGRASIAKGLDRAIHYMNAVRPVTTINSLTIVGRPDFVPYREPDAGRYIAKRLHRDIEQVTVVTGGVRSDEVADYLNGGGFSLHFSRIDSFNYAFLEQLDAGLVPITAVDTAMAEFYPPDLGHALLPREFTSNDVAKHFGHLEASYRDIWRRVRTHAAQRTDPAEFAEVYADLVKVAQAERLAIANSEKRSYTAADVSILITAYNSDQHLRDAVLSVLQQTALPKAILIADDGSSRPETDLLLTELGEMQAVTVLRFAANEGLSATRNKLLEACETELFMFLDHDDRIAPQFVEETVKALNTSEARPDAILTWRKHFGQDNNLRVDFNFDDYESFLVNVAYLAALMRTEVARKLKFVPSVRNGEADDWDFWLRFKSAGHRLVCVPKPLFHYHVASGSMSWPWSIGQAAGTANLVAPTVLEAIQSGKVPADLVGELVSIVHRTSYDANQAHRSTVAENRERLIEAAKAKSKYIGRFLELFYKGSAYIAARFVLR